MGTMETQRNTRCLGRWSPLLLLLGLVIPPATTQALSYKEAVLRAVDGLNQRSSDENLYRLLELDPLPKGVSLGGGSGEGRSALATLSLPLLRLSLLSGRHFSL